MGLLKCTKNRWRNSLSQPPKFVACIGWLSEFEQTLSMHLSMIAVMQLEDETWKDETIRVVGTEAKKNHYALFRWTLELSAKRLPDRIYRITHDAIIIIR